MNRLTRRGVIRAGSVSAGLWATSTLSASGFRSTANDIRLGLIGCGGRAGNHLGELAKMSGAKVVALADPDPSLPAKTNKKYKLDAAEFTDLRKLLELKELDAVIISTCNHWHCLAAIWAMQAGKDVYVEKPLTHSQWEGEQTIAAARKYKKICQVGTQQRSDGMQAAIKKFLHDEQGIGKLQSVRVNRFGVRQSIGKQSSPLVVDSKIDYQLWLGPAEDRPMFRDKFHYDWHWDWNTGSGEMGNWGVHVLDDVRNNVFLDKVALPTKLIAGGGRVVWNDAGETPNVHFCYFDTGTIPVVIGLSNLPAEPKSSKSPNVQGPEVGYLVKAEGGRLEGQRGSASAFDRDGKLIKKFKGNGGHKAHLENFFAAVKSRDYSSLNTDVQVGHDSTGWCNVANIAFRVGQSLNPAECKNLKDENWQTLLEEMTKHLGKHEIDLAHADLKLSKMLTIDPKTQRFVGEGADSANQLIKREYRAGYVVPTIT